WDGAGYPTGKAGEEIPLEARVLAVADAFDAMTSDRPYRRALSREEALSEVERCAGTHFDPEIARGFLGLFADPGLATAASAWLQAASSFQLPSETTSTVPSTTLSAVSSSIA